MSCLLTADLHGRSRVQMARGGSSFQPDPTQTRHRPSKWRFGHALSTSLNGFGNISFTSIASCSGQSQLA